MAPLTTITFEALAVGALAAGGFWAITAALADALEDWQRGRAQRLARRPIHTLR